MARDYSRGKDLPAEDPIPDLPVRKPDLGYGIDAADAARGYRTTPPELPGDVRAGVPTFTGEKGFLYRGSFGADR